MIKMHLLPSEVKQRNAPMKRRYNDARKRTRTERSRCKAYTKQMRKGQMEVMGLAIIIILVILGILFGIQFLKEEPTEIRAEFEQKTLATSFLNTMLGTTSNCHKATFRELVQDCAQGGQIACPSGRNSCQEAQQDFQFMLTEVLDSRKQGYKLIAKGPGQIEQLLTIDSDNPCEGERVAGVQNIPTRLGTPVEFILQICK